MQFVSVECRVERSLWVLGARRERVGRRQEQRREGATGVVVRGLRSWACWYWTIRVGADRVHTEETGTQHSHSICAW
jgi:hypothetical protein